MRAFLAAAVAATMFAGSALASDPFNGNGWQRSRPPAAVAYFSFSLQGSKSDRAAYGLAVTAPTPRRYGLTPLLIADTPKLVDLRFNGAVPHTLRLSEQVAWSMTPSTSPSGERRQIIGTVADMLGEQRRYLDIERAYTETLTHAYDARTSLLSALGVQP